MGPLQNDTGKVRILFLEFAGGGEAAQNVIRTLTSLLDQPQQPVIAPPAAIAAPTQVKPASRRKVREAAVRCGKRELLPEPTRSTMTDAIRAAIRESPKTTVEITEYVRGHGFPQAESKNISTVLCQRRNANEIYKDDAGLKWHFAERPASK